MSDRDGAGKGKRVRVSDGAVEGRSLADVLAATTDLEVITRRSSQGGHMRQWVSAEAQRQRTVATAAAAGQTQPLVYSSALASWLPPSAGPALGVSAPRAVQRNFAHGFLTATCGSMREGDAGAAGRGTGFVYHAAMTRHRPENPMEPERPQRVEATFEHLSRSGLLDVCHSIPCREATDDELLAVHDTAHVDRVDSTEFYAGANIPVVLGGDLYISRGTARAARLAAGGVTEAALRVARGEVSNAFALVRPPGHHCSATHPSGFCFFNNVAVAVEAVRSSVEGVRRVMVLDWDVHHGNGTESCFYGDPDTLVVSVHQHYMGRGHVMHRAKPQAAPPTATAAVAAAAAATAKPAAPEVSAAEVLALLGSDSSDSSSKSSRSPSSSSSSASAAADTGAPDGEAVAPPTPAPIDSAVPAPVEGERPRRARKPLITAEDEAAVGDDDALNFFAALGANVAGKCGVAGRAGTDSSRGTSSDDDDDDEDDSSQQLSLMGGDSDMGGGGGGAANGGSSASDDGTSRVKDGAGGDDDESDGSGDEYPFYPGTGTEDRTGEGPGVGRNVNIPWPCTGFGDAEYLTVLERLVVPIAREFAPDMVIISSGFDCAAGDVLGSMQVTPTGVFLMTRAMLRDVSPRVVVALEGGYTLRNVALCSEAAIRALLEASQGPAAAAQGSTMLYHQMERTIETVRRTQAPYWRCMRDDGAEAGKKNGEP